MSSTLFKQCQVCQHSWSTRDEFIADTETEVSLIGYQANFVVLEKGLFLFNHSCGGTMSINVVAFADLYNGPIYQERKVGSVDCPDYCLHSSNMRPCLEKCECAYVREILFLLGRPGTPSFLYC
jgi:hypothetical protein